MNLASEPAYFQTIEEFFVSRRGDPLFLSNADWLLIREWRRAGIPLRIVLRGIADALDSHAHSWSRHRKVGSLRYCKAEVEAARERWQRALSIENEEGVTLRKFLQGLGDALNGAANLGPAASAVAADLAPELRARGAGDPSLREDNGRTEGLEKWLGACEIRLLEALRSDLGPEALREIEEEVDEDLAPYRERMPERVLVQVRQESVARRLLETCGLPRFSLFHL